MLHLIPNNQKHLRQLGANVWGLESYLVVSTDVDKRMTVMGFRQWLTEHEKAREKERSEVSQEP